MRVRTLLCALLASAAAACGGGGGDDCAGALLDVCQKGQDLTNYLGAELVDRAASGSAILGEGGPLGGGGHAAMSIRVTMATRHMPQFGNGTLRTDGTTAPGDVPVNSGTVPVVSASGAIGLWRGAKAGDTHIGEVDLIAGLNSVPTEQDGTLRIQQKGALAAELGVRIGLLEETAKAPGVAFTFSRRMAFHLSAHASALGSDAGDTLQVAISNISSHVNSWRLTGSKRLGRFGVTAGAGRDDENTSATFVATSGRMNDAGTMVRLQGLRFAGMQLTRTNLFVGGSFKRGGTTFAGELGRVFGGEMISNTAQDGNTFAGANAPRSRAYLAVGMRIGN